MNLQELNQAEMLDTNGGSGIWDAIVGYVVENVVDAAIDAFEDTIENAGTYYDADPWDRVI
ncbi:hypothetical protein [Dokdonia donghaensis]|uniref:Bacteriocin n=1 Tax=Dokdonia donghaensis DSW-1 TaxID=1300343 RepID=A0A0A2GX64_9FLAO|nr:hypothetical protein [Dokdonia donghaensis]ANH59511.1 hypothetical protein I597_0580 [Dokdonia donghaensis DSW-1]KGO06891.1 hypothetical protein NV36_08550 [Dokdonia donghaensis DSW-1]